MAERELPNKKSNIRYLTNNVMRLEHDRMV